MARRSIQGYRGVHLLRRDVPDGAEFVTIMWFDFLEAVQEFAGEDYAVAVVPPKAWRLLTAVRRSLGALSGRPESRRSAWKRSGKFPD